MTAILRYFQNKFAVTEHGARNILVASLWTAASQLALFLPLIACFLIIRSVFDESVTEDPSPLLYGAALILGGILIFFLGKRQYLSQFYKTYEESERVRLNISEKLMKLPLSYFNKRNVADLTGTILNDVTMLETVISHVSPFLYGALIVSVLITVGVLFDNVWMALALFWAVPASLLLLRANQEAKKKLAQSNILRKIDYADYLQNSMENVQDIKSYGMTETIIEGLEKRAQEIQKEQWKLEKKISMLLMGSKVVLKLGIPTVIAVATILLMNGQMDLFKFIIYMMVSSMVYEPLFQVYDYVTALSMLDETIGRIKEVLNHRHAPGTGRPVIENFDVEFKNVTFSYSDEGETNAIENMSFVAKQGEVTAMVGPSGSGKSTVTKLVARFWDPDKGRITIGGHDVMEMSIDHLLKHVSIVFQDVVLFNQSVKENIRIGRPDATDEEVLEMAKLARCDEFVRELPDGYDTVIGENGELLSGGERQRISIARALLKDAPIILLDEATASIDSDNETRIQMALSELIKNKTVLVIAHRMRTVRNANKIVLLKDGHVLETGDPDTLLKKEGGLFRHMTEIQKLTTDWSVL